MTGSSPLSQRVAGVLCHYTSIPDGGILRFLDFLHDAGMRVWQVLPLNPPDQHRSPYQSHTLEGLDPALAELDVGPQLDTGGRAFEDFRAANAERLKALACFELLQNRHGAHWPDWPAPLRNREPPALTRLEGVDAAIAACARREFLASEAWQNVRRAARERDIHIFGDMPLYPAHQSVDVWAHPELFELDLRGEPRRVAGVPPDYFSSSGQLWGNPVYDWTAMRQSGFSWWVERLRHLVNQCDVIRIDHFRGLSAFWAVPADAVDARGGIWEPAPGAELLETLRARLGALPLVAEDLGTVDDAVLALRDRFGLPGMRVLQFAFSGDPENPHLPEHYPENCVAYTATHDNDTSAGWYASLDDAVRRVVDRHLPAGADPAWRMIEAVMASRASAAIVPLQDLLSLDGSHRMNTPGTETGNWRWRFRWAQLDGDLAARTAGLLRRCARA